MMEEGAGRGNLKHEKESHHCCWHWRQEEEGHKPKKAGGL